MSLARRLDFDLGSLSTICERTLLPRWLCEYDTWSGKGDVGGNKEGCGWAMPWLKICVLLFVSQFLAFLSIDVKM